MPLKGIFIFMQLLQLIVGLYFLAQNLLLNLMHLLL